MKRVAIYPFNKITHGLIRFRNLLDFEIKSVIDYTFCTGKDAGEEVDGNFAGIKITDNNEEGLEGIDTLILNDGGIATYYLKYFFDEHDLERKWKELVTAAVRKGIKVVSIHELDQNFAEQLKEEGINIESYIDESRQEIAKYFERLEQIRQQDTIEDILARAAKIKRVGIFGTRSCLGKYTTQLYIHGELKKRGHKLTSLVTEPTSYLFKQPDLDWGRITMSLSPLEYAGYLEAVVKSCEKDGDEYILMADQRSLAVSDTLLSNIWKMSILKMFDPNIVLLIVGYDDDNDIEDCLDVIRIYANRQKPYALLIPDKMEISYGNYETKTREQIEERKRELRDKFGIQNVECIRDVEKITDLLVAYGK